MKTKYTCLAVLLAAAVLLCFGCAEAETAPTPPATGDFTRQYVNNQGMQGYIDCDGTLYTWGSDSYNNDPDNRYLWQLGQGETVLYNNVPTAIAQNVASTWLLITAVNDSGQLLRWGDTPNGYLQSPQPVMENIKKYTSTLYLTDDGKLYACYEQPRIGQNPPYGKETTLLLEDVVDYCSTTQRTLALKTDGTLWAFQVISYLSIEVRQKPTAIMSGVRQLFYPAVGGQTALFLTENGTLYSMGENEYGQCGNGQHGDLNRSSGDAVLFEPYPVMDNIKEAWVDLSTCYALAEDGTLYGWGLNDYDILLAGDAPTSPMTSNRSIRTEPVKVLDSVKSFCTAMNVCYAIREDDSLWSWGVGNSGWLGNGTRTESDDLGTRELADEAARDPILCQPQKILDDVERLFGADTGGTLVFAEKKDGSVWYWGYDEIIVDKAGDWDTYSQSFSFYSRHEIIATPQPFDISTFHQGLGSKSK